MTTPRRTTPSRLRRPTGGPRLRTRLAGGLLALAAVAGALVAVVAVGTATAPAARAAVASNFNAGMIISDAEFYNAGSMDAGAIQAFLAAQYDGCASGYTCIRDLRVDTFDRAAVPGLCSAYQGASGESAATIIYKVSQACGVNPKAMLVLLQKESSVITSNTPNYRSATGYGCPDTAACDSRYYGFYNQVYMAAYQFERYRTYPTQYGYVAGRSNYILYNPNSACGGSNVYIQNQATAGLYIYTPYQPNAAALANLYGTGDSCSAYGNRNFWRMYTDWFGSTAAAVGPKLLKTATDGTVYLASGPSKYAVSDWDTLLALPTAWRSISTVPQATLDALTTGPTLRRLVRAADGTVSFFDAGIKLRMPSCDMVADYGYSCTSAIPLLTDGDLAAFATGPTMTSLYTTTDGRRFEIADAQRHEVLDDTALQQAGLSSATVVLTPTAIAALPYGSPLVHDGALVTNRGDGSAVLLRGSVAYRWTASTYRQTTLAAALPAQGALDAASVAFLPAAVTLTGFARDAGTGATSVVTALGRSAVTPSAWGVTPSTWPSDLLARIAAAPPLTTPVPVKSTTGPDVAWVTNGTARPVRSWSTLTAVVGDRAPYVAVLTDDEYAGLPPGPQVLAPGSLAKGDGPDLWFVDGTAKRVHLSSLAIAAELGLTSWTTDAAAVAAYPAATGDLSPAFSCGSTRYLGAGGKVLAVDPAAATALGLTFVPAAAPTCWTFAAGASGAALTGPVYARTDGDGTVYRLGDGTKHAVTSYATYQRIAPQSAVPLVYLPNGALDAIPTGAPIS